MNKIHQKLHAERSKDKSFYVDCGGSKINVYELKYDVEIGAMVPVKVGVRDMQEYVNSFYEETTLSHQLAAIANGTQQPRSGFYEDLTDCPTDMITLHERHRALVDAYGQDYFDVLMSEVASFSSHPEQKEESPGKSEKDSDFVSDFRSFFDTAVADYLKNKGGSNELSK